MNEILEQDIRSSQPDYSSSIELVHKKGTARKTRSVFIIGN